MEDFGLPTWGSYLIFALATIILGALLGLVRGSKIIIKLIILNEFYFQVLVCLIDMVYPPRVPKSVVSKTDKKEHKNKDELVSILIKYLQFYVR